MSKLTSILNSTQLIGIEQPETLRAPEIEKGVGCDFDSYLLVPDNRLDERIAAAKAALGKDVVILGHHYQRDEVVKFADFRGDSLKLSQQAADADAKYIVFCGVHFMAESADILRRGNQIVVLPDLSAGCSMADMADIGQVEACWDELQGVTDTSKIIPVTYMNSTAAIKSFTGEHGGSACTSSNAAAVMKWAFERGEKVLFLPDEHLGRNTAYRMGIPLQEMIVWDPYEDLGGNTAEAVAKARVILWKGYCSVHQRFTPRQVERGLKEGDWFLREVIAKGKVLYEAPNGSMGTQGRRGLERGVPTGRPQAAPARPGVLPLPASSRKVRESPAAKPRRRRAPDARA